MTGAPPAPGVPRSFGRRRGRPLRSGRRALLEGALPELRIAPPAAGLRLDPRSLFPGAIDEVWLEIGFGAGEHLVHQAASHAGHGFLGCEPFVNGVAALLARILDAGLSNVRVFDDDARLLLPFLPDACLARVFLLFPDPWPKKRHHRRRLVSAATLDELARVMADGAELRFATDHMEYARWTLALALAHPAFDWCAERARDWRHRPGDAVPTRYEAKALAGGARPVYLSFRRRGRG